MPRIDHTSIDKSTQRQVAADVLDMVEDRLHQLFPQVKELAERPYCTVCEAFIGNGDDTAHALQEHHEKHPDHGKDDIEQPNTLLYGENYYTLEDDLTSLFVEKFIRKGKRR